MTHASHLVCPLTLTLHWCLNARLLRRHLTLVLLNSLSSGLLHLRNMLYLRLLYMRSGLGLINLLRLWTWLNLSNHLCLRYRLYLHGRLCLRAEDLRWTWLC